MNATTAYSTDVTFDEANRTVKNTLPAIEVASWVNGSVSLSTIRPYSEIKYHNVNWIKETVDLNKNVAKTFYDNAGRKRLVENAHGQEITYVYDKAGNILSQTVENDDTSMSQNQVTSYKYDKRNYF